MTGLKVAATRVPAWTRSAAFLLAIGCGLFGMSSCGGSPQSQVYTTPKGSYPIQVLVTVDATNGAANPAPMDLTLTVN